MNKFFTTDTVMWFVRMLLVGLGSGAVSAGYVGQDEWAAISAGGVALFGVVWSYFARKNALASMPK